MNSQQFLLLNFVIVVILILFFTLGRSKPKQPVKLRLDKPTEKPEEETKKTEEVSVALARDVSSTKSFQPVMIEGPKTYFVYNGHEWDAHEVLGIKKGADLPQVTAEYQRLIKTSDPSTFEFYEAAYSAILKSRN